MRIAVSNEHVWIGFTFIFSGTCLVVPRRMYPWWRVRCEERLRRAINLFGKRAPSYITNVIVLIITELPYSVRVQYVCERKSVESVYLIYV
jgi:hypothetical protein